MFNSCQARYGKTLWNCIWKRLNPKMTYLLRETARLDVRAYFKEMRARLKKNKNKEKKNDLTSQPLMQWRNSGCGYHFSPMVQTILWKRKCNKSTTTRVFCCRCCLCLCVSFYSSGKITDVLKHFYCRIFYLLHVFN